MKKNLNKLATLALTGVLMTGMSFGALATTNATGGVNTEGGKTLVLTKELAVLDVDSGYQASAPAIKYSYAIADNLTAEELGTVSTTDSTARKDGHSVGDPTVAAEAFVATEKAVENKVSRDITLNFGSVKFTEAGVYRYKLVEGTYSSQNNFDYSNSIVESSGEDKSRYIDVYVGWNSDRTGLTITGYVVSYVDGEGKTPGYEVKVNDAGTDVTYGDKYSTYDLTVNKHVTGSLGEKGKDFSFTATVPVPTGSAYNFDNTGDAAEAVEQSDKAVNTNLKDDESFTIKGVPCGNKVKVTEADYSREGYKTYLAIDSEDYGTKENREAEQEQTDATGATVINFKNDKNETTPTGVVMNIAPYAAMILGAGAFAGVFLGRKKSEDEE